MNTVIMIVNKVTVHSLNTVHTQFRRRKLLLEALKQQIIQKFLPQIFFDRPQIKVQ